MQNYGDVLDMASLTRYTGHLPDRINVDFKERVSSTNDLLKEAADESPGWTVMISAAQTSGKGRRGRSFFSPEGTGVYLSILIKEKVSYEDTGRLTTAAAVAAARTIEECAGKKTEIKWVNDVLVGGKKVCGILTEASAAVRNNCPEWIVTGIGFNVYEPDTGFPADITDVAGAIAKDRQPGLMARLAVCFAGEFYRLFSHLHDPHILEEYRSRCIVLKKNIYVCRGDERIPAFVLDVKEDFGLEVSYEDGSGEVLKSGEVTIRPRGRCSWLS